jgi:hypothetical protein
LFATVARSLTTSQKMVLSGCEREWRMFAPLGKTHFADKSCVTRVYLGSRIDPAKRQKIIKAMDALDIEIHDMKIEKYSMTFELCS